MPAHCSASGKLLLSLLPARERRRILDTLPYSYHTANTITRRRDLEEALKKIRRERLSTDNEEYLDGTVCVAVPVESKSRQVAAALAVHAPITRIDARPGPGVRAGLRRAAPGCATPFRNSAKPFLASDQAGAFSAGIEIGRERQPREHYGTLQDKVALVTGAAQGIGRATALLLAREGAAVAVADVNARDAEAVAEQIRAGGGKARAWTLDVSKEAEVAAVIAEVGKEFGRLDILVNNAGISGANGTAEEITEAEWDKVMNTNAKSVFLCTKHAVPLMRRNGGGSIVNLSSVYGIVGSHNVAAYHASKGAIRIMSKTDALAFAEDRIRVNSVHPGFIWTPMLEAGAQVPGVAPEAVHAAMAKLHPLGTLGEPDDVAHGILYLASDEAKFVTGSELVIDGGYTAR